MSPRRTPPHGTLAGGTWTRRSALRAMGAAALVAPFAQLLRPGRALANGGPARRVIFFYFPDGVPGPSQAGEPSAWHATGSGANFTLPEAARPLDAWRDRCVFFRGLSMGPTDAGSHPGGAKKLLTATDQGQGESIDQVLSRTAGASAYWRHLYLGVQANANQASGDKHIVYPTAGQSIPPEDDPRQAFARLFGAATPSVPPTSGGVAWDPRRSVLDGVLEDLGSLRAKLGAVDAAKMNLHLESLRELEARLGTVGTPTGAPAALCEAPAIDTGTIRDDALYDPAAFGDLLRAQIDLAVLASACGLTRVVTVQASTHTSELILSRIPGSPMYDPGFDMRSHQASHYGASHNPASREYTDYVKQRQWWMSQFAYLLQRLDETPDVDGTMLDTSLVVLCTEVCDGNTHLHDDMPFVLAGGACGRLSTGRLLDVGYRRHADLWLSVASAMGQDFSWFGDASSGPIPGLL
jgi:hypothetical protein